MILTIVILGILVGIWSITGAIAVFHAPGDWNVITEFILTGPLAWVIGAIIAVVMFICVLGRCFIFGFKNEWPW